MLANGVLTWAAGAARLLVEGAIGAAGVVPSRAAIAVCILVVSRDTWSVSCAAGAERGHRHGRADSWAGRSICCKSI